MAGLKGFWSYVHADDDAEGGRVSGLARDVANQYQLLTADELALFLDKDALNWGDDWRDRIDRGLASVAFFIPVLTPRYFMSAECRRELHFFAREASRLGVKELVLPLLYVTVPLLEEDGSTDALISLVRTFQWEDWRELRFAEPSSERYRRAVARLASRLVDANRRAEEVDLTAVSESIPSPTDIEEAEPPGMLERMAATEEALPRWPETLEAITEKIQFIGHAMQQATDEINRPGPKPTVFALRLGVAKRLAKKITEPSEQIRLLSDKFSAQLHDVDDGFRLLIARVPEEIEAESSLQKDACHFFSTVRKLASAANDGLGGVKEMTEAITPIEHISRDLRAPLRELRHGLTVMLEAREVIEDWVTMIEATAIDCGSELAEGR